jgi:hypothetical protein
MAAALALAGCSSYGESVAPVPVPSDQANAVDVDGVRLVARVYQDPAAAERAFGFDIRRAGLLPVQFVVDNQSGRNVALRPQQTLLQDDAGQGWPLLSSEVAAERIRESVAAGETIKAGAKGSLLTGLAGAVAGAAIGIVTGNDVAKTAGKGAAAGAAVGAIGAGATTYGDLGREIRRDLARHEIEDRLIKDGELAYGFLFFPGKEDVGAPQSLRLGLRIGDTNRVTTLPVTIMNGTP